MLEPVNGVNTNDILTNEISETTPVQIKPNENNKYERTPNNDTVELSTKNNKRKAGFIAGIMLLTGAAVIVDFALNKGRAYRHVEQGVKEFFGHKPLNKDGMPLDTGADKLKEKAEAEAKQKAEEEAKKKAEEESKKKLEEETKQAENKKDSQLEDTDKKSKGSKKSGGGSGSGGGRIGGSGGGSGSGRGLNPDNSEGLNPPSATLDPKLAQLARDIINQPRPSDIFRGISVAKALDQMTEKELSSEYNALRNAVKGIGEKHPATQRFLEIEDEMVNRGIIEKDSAIGLDRTYFQTAAEFAEKNFGRVEKEALENTLKAEDKTLREVMDLGEDYTIQCKKIDDDTIFAYIERSNGNRIIYNPEEKYWMELKEGANNNAEFVAQYMIHPEWKLPMKNELRGVIGEELNEESMIVSQTIFDKKFNEYAVIKDDVMSFYYDKDDHLLMSLDFKTGEILEEKEPSYMFEHLRNFDENATITENGIVNASDNAIRTAEQNAETTIEGGLREAEQKTENIVEAGIKETENATDEAVSQTGNTVLNETLSPEAQSVLEHTRSLITARGEEKVLKGFNIPKESKYAIEYAPEQGRTVIVKENGNLIVPGFKDNGEQLGRYFIPVKDEEAELLDDLVVTINGKKYIEYDLGIKTTPNSENTINRLIGEFERKEMADNALIYKDSAISEFKKGFDKVSELADLSENESFSYIPQISGKGDVVIKRANGNVIKTFDMVAREKGKEIPKEFDYFINREGFIELNAENKTVAVYGRMQPFENAPAYPVKMNDRVIEILDTRTDERCICMQVEGAPDVYMSKDGRILELIDGTPGADVPLRSGKYFYSKGNPPEGFAKVRQLQRVDGGIDYVYEMPDGTLIFPEDFHFPGSAFQQHISQIAEENERRVQQRNYNYEPNRPKLNA